MFAWGKSEVHDVLSPSPACPRKQPYEIIGGRGHIAPHPVPLPRGEREKGRGGLAIGGRGTWTTPPSIPLPRGGVEGAVQDAKGMCKKKRKTGSFSTSGE